MKPEVKDEHPPIPPNCRYFERAYDLWGFRNSWEQDWSANHSILVLLTEDNQKHWVTQYGTANLQTWRPIIAAVARCAWLDEHKRVNAEWEMFGISVRSGAIDNKGSAAKMEAYYQAYEASLENAEAWRVWGQQEARA